MVVCVRVCGVCMCGFPCGLSCYIMSSVQRFFELDFASLFSEYEYGNTRHASSAFEGFKILILDLRNLNFCLGFHAA